MRRVKIRCCTCKKLFLVRSPDFLFHSEPPPCWSTKPGPPPLLPVSLTELPRLKFLPLPKRRRWASRGLPLICMILIKQQLLLNFDFVFSILQTITYSKALPWKFAFFSDGVTGLSDFLWERNAKEEASGLDHENFVKFDVLILKPFCKNVSDEAQNFGISSDRENVKEVDTFFGEILVNLSTALYLINSGIALNHFEEFKL